MTVFPLLLSLVLLGLSVPIFMVFGVGSAIAAVWGMNLPWSTLIQVAFGSMTKHVLIAVPLFIFTGMVMLRGGAAARLVHLATTLVGHWPGRPWVGNDPGNGLFCGILWIDPRCDNGNRNDHDPKNGRARL